MTWAWGREGKDASLLEFSSCPLPKDMGLLTERNTFLHKSETSMQSRFLSSAGPDLSCARQQGAWAGEDSNKQERLSLQAITPSGDSVCSGHNTRTYSTGFSRASSNPQTLKQGTPALIQYLVLPPALQCGEFCVTAWRPSAPRVVTEFFHS